MRSVLERKNITPWVEFRLVMKGENTCRVKSRGSSGIIEGSHSNAIGGPLI